MKTIAAADIETDPFEYMVVPECFSVGFFDGIIYRDWWGVNAVRDFIRYIVEDYEEKDLIIYMHFGGRFDFHYMLEYFDEELMIINGAIVKATIGSIEFRDSFFMLPLPLSAHNKEKVDYGIFKKEYREIPKNKRIILKYLKSDCVYLYEWVKGFIDKFGLHLTIATASFNQLKDTGYDIKNTNARYDDIFRNYYYGGRTEVFEGGEHHGKIEYFDINSAYSKAMCSKHPWGNRYTVTDELPSKPPYFAIVYALSYGALPIREIDPITDKEVLLFPDDGRAREYFATGWEIEAGLRTGMLKIIRVIKVYVHDQNYSFKTFVDKFYKEKVEAKAAGDKDTETFTKFILNSCYGKFALNPRKFESYFLTRQGEIPQQLADLYCKYKVNDIDNLYARVIADEDLSDSSAQALGDKVKSWTVVNDTAHGLTVWACKTPSYRFYNVATAASITGHVRAMLWETICACERPLYCDTDSIMCYGFKGKVSDKIGDWKKEADIGDLYIGGKKLYAARIKAKQLHYKGKGKVSRENENYNIWLKKHWKVASKGSRLTHVEITAIVQDNHVVKWKKAAPAFSLRFGSRFIDRDIKRTC